MIKNPDTYYQEISNTYLDSIIMINQTMKMGTFTLKYTIAIYVVEIADADARDPGLSVSLLDERLDEIRRYG